MSTVVQRDGYQPYSSIMSGMPVYKIFIFIIFCWSVTLGQTVAMLFFATLTLFLLIALCPIAIRSGML